MPYTEEQHRKGQLLKRRMLSQGLKIPQLVEVLKSEGYKASARQIEYIYAGKTWNLGTVDRIMGVLGMDDSDLGDDLPDPTVDDVRTWAEFPDDVKVTLIVYGKWLSQFPVQRRFEEVSALTDHMKQRWPNG